MAAIDAAIIGAGPAGSALAAALAAGGWRVALIEKERFPRDKLCGEFLSGESQHLLARLGCLPRLLDLQPNTITRARFTVPDGRALDLPLPAAAFGISRLALDALLAQHAVACGATLLDGHTVRAILPDVPDVPDVPGAGGVTLRLHDESTLHAPLVIAAWGRHTPLDRELGRRFMDEPQPYVGFKLHHAVADAPALRDLRPCVEVHTFDGGYCGLNFIETGDVNVCMLLQPRALDRVEGTPDAAALRRMLAATSAPLAARLDALTPRAGRPLAVARVPFNRKEVSAHGGRLLFIGDAGGVIAPLCGDGQAMALQSAVTLGRRLLARATRPHEWRADDFVVLGRHHAQDHARQFRLRLVIGNALQAALFLPRVATGMIGLMRHMPGLADWLVRATRGAN
ncbi:MAG: NAD(P)/FAD-dependent oxidoreductase [Planctomycetota bacterium]